MNAVNRNRSTVYPQAEADIEPPKKLSEKDRGLLAHGLAKDVGAAAVGDYFEIPGFQIKRADTLGTDVFTKIHSGLTTGVLKDGKLNIATLDQALGGRESKAIANWIFPMETVECQDSSTLKHK